MMEDWKAQILSDITVKMNQDLIKECQKKGKMVSSVINMGSDEIAVYLYAKLSRHAFVASVNFLNQKTGKDNTQQYIEIITEDLLSSKKLFEQKRNQR